MLCRLSGGGCCEQSMAAGSNLRGHDSRSEDAADDAPPPMGSVVLQIYSDHEDTSPSPAKAWRAPPGDAGRPRLPPSPCRRERAVTAAGRVPGASVGRPARRRQHGRAAVHARRRRRRGHADRALRRRGRGRPAGEHRREQRRRHRRGRRRRGSQRAGPRAAVAVAAGRGGVRHRGLEGWNRARRGRADDWRAADLRDQKRWRRPGVEPGPSGDARSARRPHHRGERPARGARRAGRRPAEGSAPQHPLEATEQVLRHPGEFPWAAWSGDQGARLLR
ncbi:unnamed protein product, partial [Prorocentrum cordatum]